MLIDVLKTKFGIIKAKELLDSAYRINNVAPVKEALIIKTIS